MIRLDADDDRDADLPPEGDDPGDPGPAIPRAPVLLWAVYVDRRIAAIVDSYQEAKDQRDRAAAMGGNAFIDLVDDTANVGDAREHRPPARGEPATERPSVRFTRATMEAIERRRGKRSVSQYLADLVDRDREGA